LVSGVDRSQHAGVEGWGKVHRVDIAKNLSEKCPVEIKRQKPLDAIFKALQAFQEISDAFTTQHYSANCVFGCWFGRFYCQEAS
jgi:hypothetical protein